MAQRGRSLGVHLVLATQRPGSAVTPEIRANTSLRIALRVTDPAESTDVIDAPDAAFIDRRCPGRAYLRSGSALTAFQAAHTGRRGATPDRPVVELLDEWRRAAVRHATARPGRPISTMLVDGDRTARGRAAASRLRAARGCRRCQRPHPAHDAGRRATGRTIAVRPSVDLPDRAAA